MLNIDSLEAIADITEDGVKYNLKALQKKGLSKETAQTKAAIGRL